MQIMLPEGGSTTVPGGRSPQDVPDEIRLPPPAGAPATVRGVVYDSNYQPLGGATVLLYDLVDPRSGGSAKTGPDGAFVNNDALGQRALRTHITQRSDQFTRIGEVRHALYLGQTKIGNPTVTPSV